MIFLFLKKKSVCEIVHRREFPFPLTRFWYCFEIRKCVFKIQKLSIFFDLKKKISFYMTSATKIRWAITLIVETWNFWFIKTLFVFISRTF